MDTYQWIEHLCSKGHRGSTTPEESWAADEIRSHFSSLGLMTERQDFKGHKTYGEKLLVHLIPAIVVAALTAFYPDFAVLSSIILIILILSFFAESYLLTDILSRIFPKRDSANVFARIPNDRCSQRILITAHHDSQKEGQIFNPRMIDLMKKRFSTTSRITPIHMTFLSIVALLFTTFLYSANLEAKYTMVHTLTHLGFISWASFSTLLVLEWAAGSNYVPGANDNASGVAVMLSIAKEIMEMSSSVDHYDLSGTEICFLSTGCEETGMGGALNFIEKNESFLTAKPTYVLCFDGFGTGVLHYLTWDGIMKTRPYDVDLISLGKEIAKKHYGEERPFVSRVFTDGLAFSTIGIPAITFVSLEKDLTISHYHWRTDIPENISMESVREARDFLLEYITTLIARAPAPGSESQLVGTSAQSQSPQSSSSS